jgi:hypothetical protein
VTPTNGQGPPPVGTGAGQAPNLTNKVNEKAASSKANGGSAAVAPRPSSSDISAIEAASICDLTAPDGGGDSSQNVRQAGTGNPVEGSAGTPFNPKLLSATPAPPLPASTAVLPAKPSPSVTAASGGGRAAGPCDAARLRLHAHDIARQFRRLADNGPCSQNSLLSVLNRAKQGVEQFGKVETLPPIYDASTLVSAPPATPPELITGLLHRGEELVFAGGSKSFKTWGLLDLALSVSRGVVWLEFATVKGRVLFINLELPDWAMRERLKRIAWAKSVSLEPGQLKVWNLRGCSAGFDRLFPQLESEIEKGNYALVVIDPIYKVLGGLDENAAGDVGELMNAFEALAAKGGAASAFAAHFSKGNQSGKAAIDRISGSGVFGRDPDTLVTLTLHEESEAYAMEFTLRNFPPQPAFVVRWLYPRFEAALDLNPAQLRQPRGRVRKHEPQALLAALMHTSAEAPITTTAWAELAGVPRSTLRDYIPGLRSSGWIEVGRRGLWITEAGKKAAGVCTGAGEGGGK